MTPPEGAVEARFRYEPEDVREAMSVERWRARLLVAVALGGLAAWIAWTARGIPGFAARLFTDARFLGLLAVGALSLGWVLLVMPARAARETHRKLGDGETEWRVEEDGFSIETRHGRTRYEWEYLARWRETPALFMLYPTRQLVFILPKRALSEAQAARVRALLAARVTRASWLR